MANQITYYQTREVWENCIQDADISINQEDKDILKRLGKLLGQTDVEGQVSEIEVTQNFLNMQIEKAEELGLEYVDFKEKNNWVAVKFLK